MKGTHEPLISRELFEQVQAIRVQAAAKYKQNEKIPYSPNILKGRIYCAYCGKSLHRQKSHDRYFFRCISDDRIGEGACPGDIRLLPEKELFDAILTIIQKEAAVIIGTGCRLKRSGSDAEQKAATEKEIARFQQEMERDRKYLIRLYEDFVTGILAPAEYTELKTGYEQKIKTATAQSQQLSAQQKELETQMSSYIELSDWLTSLNGDVALTGDLIERLVERIVVYGPQKIEVYFKFRNEFGEVNKDG